MISKEEFLTRDRIIKGLSNDGHFKISVVKTTDVVELARKRHGLSPMATVVLGRALTGVMLLASELKSEERVQLRIEGDGPIGFVSVEANAVGEIRGYVAHADATLEITSDFSIGELVGKGVLQFSKVLYNEAKPITGIVELVSGTVTEDLAHYLSQSEQIPSALTLDVQLNEDGSVAQAGGILVQALPGAPVAQIEFLAQRISETPPIGRLYSEGNYIDDVMNLVMGDMGVHELTRYPVHFFCRCNKDRFVNALHLLGIEDLHALNDQGQELACHYCGERYAITKQEIDEIIHSVKVRMN